MLMLNGIDLMKKNEKLSTDKNGLVIHNSKHYFIIILHHFRITDETETELLNSKTFTALIAGS